jgi:hypothetical protein
MIMLQVPEESRYGIVAGGLFARSSTGMGAVAATNVTRHG